MIKTFLPLTAVAALVACNAEPAANNTAGAGLEPPQLSLARLDCGTATIKNFDAFFSDRPGLYERGPREITDSCYLIRNGDQVMIWDTGFSGELKGQERDMGELVARLGATLPEQLAQLNLKPEDVDVVGISHMHPDHTGQAAQFPMARLVIGRGDFVQSAGAEDPFRPWRGKAHPVTLATGNVDIFRDGKVIALHTPGHTPDHLVLLVNLESGPVLLSGDLYHSSDAREKRGVPPFNTSREQTLASMDRFERIARERGAKVIIQHEPRDIGKLPAFPEAAR